MAERIEVLGCPVDVLTMDTAILRLGDAITERRACQVVTANAEIIYVAQHDPELYLVLHDAGLVTADGAGVVLASRILGRPLPERVAGVDLVHALAKRGAESGWGFYLLGAKPEVVEAAVGKLQELYPGLRIVGWRDGYFGPEAYGQVAEQVKQSQADVLLVAMGAPKQDKWLHDYLAKCGASVGIGVGGTFDILAGKVERAPLWMQRAGLEWLFRLLKQPSRFWRMLALPKFLWAVLMQKWRR